MFPPHTRGWTTVLAAAGHHPFVSPAHAGMDRTAGSLLAVRIGFPRTRGDGPESYWARSDACSFPPHTRGWTPEVRWIAFHRLVSPAHAGMDLIKMRVNSTMNGFPRTRGDGPSPHDVVHLIREVSPAHAGMDRAVLSTITARSCFPRTRGDGPGPAMTGHASASFPPHTRGWTCVWSSLRWLCSVSPAHAGMDRTPDSCSIDIPGFPRTRGDGPSMKTGNFQIPEFPPHTRGWTDLTSSFVGAALVSPAHAGMDPRIASRASTQPGFPRTRGDGPDSSYSTRCRCWFPPHTRGWTHSTSSGGEA